MPRNQNQPRHQFKHYEEMQPEFKRAKIPFRTNFAGREEGFNKDGKHEFALQIDDSAKAQELAERGWQIKTRYNRDDPDQVDFYFINCEVAWPHGKNFPTPVVKQVTSETHTPTVLDEETIGLLDEEDIICVNVKLRPFNWYDDRDKKEKVKAYVARLTALVREDTFDDMDFDGDAEIIISNPDTNTVVYDSSVEAMNSVDDDEIPF